MSFQASWMKRSIKNIVKGSDKQDNSFAEIILLILAIGAAFWFYQQFAPTEWNVWADLVGVNVILFSVLLIWKLFVNRLCPFKNKGK